MACFIVPLTQAVATTMLRRKNRNNQSVSTNAWLAELPKLELMLWGGSVMLIFDHIINGEVTMQYPFFTALNATGGAMTMLKEMLFVGLPMSLAITGIYCIMVAIKKFAIR